MDPQEDLKSDKQKNPPQEEDSLVFVGGKSRTMQVNRTTRGQFVVLKQIDSEEKGPE